MKSKNEKKEEKERCQEDLCKMKYKKGDRVRWDENGSEKANRESEKGLKAAPSSKK